MGTLLAAAQQGPDCAIVLGVNDRRLLGRNSGLMLCPATNSSRSGRPEGPPDAAL